MQIINCGCDLIDTSAEFDSLRELELQDLLPEARMVVSGRLLQHHSANNLKCLHYNFIHTYRTNILYINITYIILLCVLHVSYCIILCYTILYIMHVIIFKIYTIPHSEG